MEFSTVKFYSTSARNKDQLLVNDQIKMRSKQSKQSKQNYALKINTFI